MDQKAISIIGVITSNLPRDVAVAIYNEFQSRMQEVNYFITTQYRFQRLKKVLRAVEILLALSIFHKRLMTNIDAANKFHHSVTTISDADTISIGRYNLDDSEKNKITHLLTHYRALKQRFGVEDRLLEYNETKDFLQQIITFKTSFGKRRRN